MAPPTSTLRDGKMEPTVTAAWLPSHIIDVTYGTFITGTVESNDLIGLFPSWQRLI